jgi:hypothetical protein
MNYEMKSDKKRYGKKSTRFIYHVNDEYATIQRVNELESYLNDCSRYAPLGVYLLL